MLGAGDAADDDDNDADDADDDRSDVNLCARHARDVDDDLMLPSGSAN